MQAAIRSPLAAGVALIGAGTIAATPITAPPPEVHISDLQLTVSSRLMVANPIALGEELVGQTLSDSVRQATRAASFPVAKAIVLNLASALEGRAPRRGTVNGTSLPIGVPVGTFGGGLLTTIPNLVLDGLGTTMRLVPAVVGAGLGVVRSTVNSVAMTGLATVRAVMNVGAAALTLNPVTVLNAAALGAERVAGVVEQTTIGTGALVAPGPQPYEVARRIPSIATSIFFGRQEIANAIFPVNRQAAAVPAQLSNTSAAVTAKAATATTQKTAPTSTKRRKRR